MAGTAVTRALEILQELDADELQQVRRVIEERLQQRGELNAMDAFHQALLASGLVKAVKAAPHRAHGERPLVPIQGKPLSETISEERR